jgi:chitodextrinase
MLVQPKSIQLSVCSLLCLFLSSNAFAFSVTLAWDASSDPGVAGYFLYYGNASTNYSVKLDVGNYTTATVSGLLQTDTYYFAMTTYDTYEYESAFSSPEVVIALSDPTPPADSTPPTVTIASPLNGASVSKNSTVTISATASDNVGVTTVVFYVNGNLTCSDTMSPYTCAWKVPGAPRRTYHLQAKAYDVKGNVGASSVVTVNVP